MAGGRLPRLPCGVTVLSSSYQAVRLHRAWAAGGIGLVRHLSRSWPLKLSMNAFCVGVPGAV